MISSIDVYLLTISTFLSMIVAVVVGMQRSSLTGEERCVTSDDPNNGCEGDYHSVRFAPNLCFKASLSAKPLI